MPSSFSAHAAAHGGSLPHAQQLPTGPMLPGHQLGMDLGDFGSGIPPVQEHLGDLAGSL